MPSSQPNIQEDERGVTFVAKIVPGSSKTAVVGLLDGMIKVKVAAPPEKGKANQCLIAFLAKKLGVKKNAIRIVTGQTNPVKHVQITGVSAETLQRQLDLRA
ncbi:MAG: DUF167 domain-containing protein [Phycisphaerales bacterium]|nr:MAG: DUF167 domain-containing protein [Phycisphaerales bacterium]